MSGIRKTIAQLFKQQADAEKKEAEEVKDEATEKGESDTESTDDEVTEEASEAEESDKATADASAETEALDADTKEAFVAQIKALKAENATLAKKAKQWDEYQAALKGGSMEDLSGGENKGAKDAESTEYGRLKARYPKLMEGL